MSGLGWTLRRLGAMGAGEIAHRGRIAIRDRFFAPAWTRLTPAAAHHALFAHPRALFGGAGHRPPHERHAKDLERAARWLPGPNALATADADAILAHAAAFARGEWSLFGHAVKLADPIDWNANPITGARWPDAPSRAIDYRDAGDTGGAKFVCELGRLTFLPELALAARLGDEAAGARALAVLADFAKRNPLGHGIHHTSGIEMAIRVATTSATLALLAPRHAAKLDDALEPALGLAAQQALWCRDHLSLGSSANNHLLAELMSVAVMAGAWPSLKHSEKLVREAKAAIEREVRLQFHADGVNAEQAFGYLPFVWELVLLGLRAADAAGHEIAPDVRERLVASLEFARALRGPDGRAPQVGDEDDGRVLLASLDAPRLDLVGNALAAWLGVDPLSDSSPAYAQLLGLSPRPARAAKDGRHDFAEGGWTIWRDRGLRVTFDHGPLGLGSIAGHGHADALSVTIARGADELVVDPGTLAYHEDEAARNESRGTPAHATVSFREKSQSEMLGPFLWGRRAVVTPEGDGFACRWASGETHVRTVRVENGVVSIEDRVSGRDPRVGFPLPPGALAGVDGTRAIVDVGATRAVFTSEGLARWQLESSRHAPRFSHRADAQKLAAGFEGERGTTTIRIEARG